MRCFSHGAIALQSRENHGLHNFALRFAPAGPALLQKDAMPLPPHKAINFPGFHPKLFC